MTESPHLTLDEKMRPAAGAINYTKVHIPARQL
jgi:hypothetical protein